MDAVAVRTDRVTKTFGEVTALDQVSIEIASGTVYGLIGPNGAGKTTMLGLLAGLTSPTDGSVDVETTFLGVLPDTPLFDKWLTGREVVNLALNLSAKHRAESRVDKVLEIVGLDKDKSRRVRG
jgi:ABC-2 type transport system ATP-binding protein